MVKLSGADWVVLLVLSVVWAGIGYALSEKDRRRLGRTPGASPRVCGPFSGSSLWCWAWSSFSSLTPRGSGGPNNRRRFPVHPWSGQPRRSVCPPIPPSANSSPRIRVRQTGRLRGPMRLSPAPSCRSRLTRAPCGPLHRLRGTRIPAVDFTTAGGTATSGPHRCRLTVTSPPIPARISASAPTETWPLSPA